MSEYHYKHGEISGTVCMLCVLLIIGLVIISLSKALQGLTLPCPSGLTLASTRLPLLTLTSTNSLFLGLV